MTSLRETIDGMNIEGMTSMQVLRVVKKRKGVTGSITLRTVSGVLKDIQNGTTSDSGNGESVHKRSTKSKREKSEKGKRTCTSVQRPKRRRTDGNTSSGDTSSVVSSKRNPGSGSRKAKPRKRSSVSSDSGVSGSDVGNAPRTPRKTRTDRPSISCKTNDGDKCKSKSRKNAADNKSSSVRPDRKRASSSAEIRFNGKVKGYEWLSNFFPCAFDIPIDGELVLFRSAEHAFQYMKTDSAEFKEKILNAADASKARYWGSAKAGCPLRDTWEDEREDAMAKIVAAKFEQNEALHRRLRDTGMAKLVELAPWDKEKFWGVDAQGEGENVLGEILMDVRQELSV